ncbi:MAG: hypothetical protein M1821_000265 [Bathelium mastoideum]|nr:MAG: hypothetical protein M1821_000265 [Bathelium mastoideum]
MIKLSDLVRDSKLETWSDRGYFVHERLETRTEYGKRPVPRREFWQRQRRIGGGGFGAVWLEKCVHGQRSGELRAVKQISMTSSTRLRPGNFSRELEAIAKFSHEKYDSCFVKSFGWFALQDAFFITMEFLEQGDLAHHLRQAPELAENEAASIIHQVVEGLNFMHGNDFAHRDLKPGNLLIKSQPPQDWWIKIADFGISKRIGEESHISNSLKGTLGFIAPELLGFGERGTDKAADMWSLGEIAFQLMTKVPTFQNPGMLFKYVQDPRIFPVARLQERRTSSIAEEFIRQVMAPTPGERLTAEEALLHGWFKPIAHQDSFPDDEPIASAIYALVGSSSEELATWNTRQNSKIQSTVYEDAGHNDVSSREKQSDTMDPLPRLQPSQSQMSISLKSSSEEPLRQSSGESKSVDTIRQAQYPAASDPDMTSSFTVIDLPLLSLPVTATHGEVDGHKISPDQVKSGLGITQNQTQQERVVLAEDSGKLKGFLRSRSAPPMSFSGKPPMEQEALEEPNYPSQGGELATRSPASIQNLSYLPYVPAIPSRLSAIDTPETMDARHEGEAHYPHSIHLEQHTTEVETNSATPTTSRSEPSRRRSSSLSQQYPVQEDDDEPLLFGISDLGAAGPSTKKRSEPSRSASALLPTTKKPELPPDETDPLPQHEDDSGSSSSVSADEDDIADFLKLLERGRKLTGLNQTRLDASEALTRRKAAAITTYQRAQDLDSASSDSLSASA